MQMYSVYDYGRRQYDYYQSDEVNGTHAGAPPIRAHKQLGATPEQSAWLVPASAVKVGSGPFPKGRIAVPSGMSGVLGDVPASSAKVVVLGLAAYLIWRATR